MARLIWTVLLSVSVVQGCVFAPTYNGTINVTSRGFTCQRWDSQTPHKHPKTGNDHYPIDGTSLDAHNYCRDVNGFYELWCYTTDPDVKWDKCNISICEPPDVDEAECEVLPENETSHDCPIGTDFYDCLLGIFHIRRHILYHFNCDRYYCCKMAVVHDEDNVSTEKVYQHSERDDDMLSKYYNSTMKTTQLERNGSKPMKSFFISDKIVFFLLIFKVINIIAKTCTYDD